MLFVALTVVVVDVAMVFSIVRKNVTTATGYNAMAVTGSAELNVQAVFHNRQLR